MVVFQTYWEPLLIGVDAAIVFLLYRAYKNRRKEAQLLYDTPIYEVGPELRSVVETLPQRHLDYVCIQGVVNTAGKQLSSQFTDRIGVVQHHFLVEHKSRRVQGTWNDFRRVIHNVYNYHPFYIVNPEDTSDHKIKVVVSEILAAEFLQDNLPVVYNKFRPVKENILSKGMDLVCGEMTRGYQEIEKILDIGAQVLGVGRVSLDGNKLILQPPLDSRRYIVTTLSKPEIVRLMKSDAKMFKVLLWMFLIMGTGIISYSICKFVMRLLQERESRRIMEELRQQMRLDNDGNADDNGSCCIICLSNHRDAIILNCGHLCLCAECALALPEPKMCPVCRSRVARIVPVYVS